jgi:hypothetical protein
VNPISLWDMSRVQMPGVIPWGRVTTGLLRRVAGAGPPVFGVLPQLNASEDA